MIPDSFIARNAIYSIAIMQTAVAPLAFMYFLYYLATDHLFISFSPMIDTLMYYWLGCELIFYVFFQITRNRMQSPLQPIYPGPKERRTLYFNCINNIVDVEEWLVGWFMRSHNPEQQPMIHEIRRENLAEWIAWAFFAQPLESVLEDEDATTEMYWMINHFADKFGLDFTPGYDEDIIAFRLTLDPVQAYHRPLVFYLFIISMTYLNTFLLYFWGFKKFGPDIPSALSLGWSSSESTLSRSSASNSSSSSSLSTSTGRVAYWYREGKNPNKKPIVFIHGIGPGLLPYLKFVYHLLDIDAPLFCVEQPYVSMRCIEDVPSMQETVQDLERMLHFHGFRDAVYVSHSLGTALTSWAVQHIPKTVAGVVMLDPICFMLHYKDICVNFVYRIPKTASESIVKFFASSELYISYYISRHFHWFQLALYVTPKSSPRQTRSSRRRRSQHQNRTIRMPRATKVFLSEHDNIVNSSRVHEYLSGNGVNSVVMAGLDHGWFLFKSAWQQQILDTVSDYASIDN